MDIEKIYMARRTIQKENPQIRGLMDHMSGYLDGRIVVFGGAAKPRKLNVLRYYVSNHTIWTFNPENDCWMSYDVPADEPAPPATIRPCGAVLNSDLFMFGGYLQRGDEDYRLKISNALWKLHRTKAKQFSWTQITFENNASQPSPRAECTAWEYDDKLWIYGGYGHSFEGFMHDNKAKFYPDGDAGVGLNNQLFVFDPSCGKWSIPDMRGEFPPVEYVLSAARIGDQVWLYSAVSGHMYVLGMRSLVLSSQSILGVPPSARQCYTFTPVSDSQIVLHGGYSLREPLSDTWIFNTELGRWRQHTGPHDHARFAHSAVKASNNSVMILGGMDTRSPEVEDDAELNVHNDIFWVRLEPDSLRKQCLKVVLEHVDIPKLTPMDIPANLLADLNEMTDGDKSMVPPELLLQTSNEEDASDFVSCCAVPSGLWRLCIRGCLCACVASVVLEYLHTARSENSPLRLYY